MSQATRLVPTSGPGSGTVTSISAGTSITLTPNPITTTGTVALTTTNLTTVDGTVYWDGSLLNTTAVGTAGWVLTSNGAGMPPTYQAAMASGSVTTLHTQDGNNVTPTLGVVNISGGSNLTTTGTVGPNTVTISLSGITQHSLQVGGAANALTQLGVASNGQLPIGSAGADPVLATITAGNNITVTNGAGSITIAANGGAQVVNYTGVNHAASPYTVLATDYYISADVTGGVISILLPNAPSTGRIFVIKDKVGLAATSNITVTTVGGAVNIDGATSFVMNTAYESIQLIFNGTSYEVY